MRERDTVRFELAGKLRLGVVIEVQGDRVRVAYGTTQDHAAPCELVSEGSRQGRSFPLREPTRFYGANTCWERASDLERGAKPCSWDLLNAIRSSWSRTTRVCSNSASRMQVASSTWPSWSTPSRGSASR